MRTKLVVLAVVGVIGLVAFAQAQEGSAEEAAGVVPDDEIGTVAVGAAEDARKAFDPLLPLNYVCHGINYPLARYVSKPIAIGYSYIIPRPARHGINNCFNNMVTPFRSLNNLLQGKVRSSGSELKRFFINTTAGGLGFYDFAAKKMGIEPQPEDLGQTFGKWHLPEGPYLCLPVLGPTTLRDLLSHLTMSRDGVEWYRGEKLGPISYAVGYSIFMTNAKSLTYGSYDESLEMARQAGVNHYFYIRDNYVDIRHRKAKDLPPRK
ncbi:VacJ family lipoprotein [Candidatus Sumerlaeota bacterium]